MISRLARLTVAGTPRIVDLARLRPTFPHLDARRDFGAAGDRSTDDQAALEDALAEGRDQGLPVYLPPGGYVHSARLPVESVTVFSVVPGAAALLGTGAITHACDLTGTNPGLHNLVIAGPGKAPRTSDRGGNGVYINGATGYIVRGCHLLDHSGTAIMGEFSSGGLVRGNLIERTGADGIYHTEACHDVEVAYNRTMSTGDDALSVASYPSGGQTHNIEFHHNSVLGQYEARAITVNGGNAITIHDNHVDGGTAGITTCSTTEFGTLATSNVEAYSNTVRRINQARQNTGTIGGGALHLWNDLGSADTGISMHNNQIYDPGLYGIFVGGTGSITASVINNSFAMDAALTLYQRTGGGAGTITQTGNTRGTVASYTGDLVAATVGGIDPTYRYAPA